MICTLCVHSAVDSGKLPPIATIIGLMIKILMISAWLLLVHTIALLAIFDTDLLYRIDRKLGTGLLNPPEITQYHEDMLGSQLQLDSSVEAGSVIFLGDSLTQGLNVAAVTHPAINYGIGMDTSAALLGRIGQYQSLTKASAIVVEIGINDLIRTSRSNAQIVENIQQILDSLPDQVPVIVQSVFPVDERFGMTGFNQRIRTLNAAIADLAASQSFEFLDLHDAFADEDGNLKDELHTGDGIHLSAAAYQQWISSLKERL
ncbi:GDSL-type esterase/lipase family protein [Leucothrix pacifica]|uniref:GDSL-type esterase/lipase family protein n=1 Tax=Leucothrix pacifica TaxID=1247513 RepID=UPI001C644D84|nr:GDSL-type esterase/lipase family protein [Leucothrix pacifica]